MARRDEGAYPQRSVTEEQRSQTAFCPKTLRAAGLLPVAGVGSLPVVFGFIAALGWRPFVARSFRWGDAPIWEPMVGL